ncbi:MAG: leucine-rich repeat domain-containing protein [Candidatus Thorarchaeota archaeon]|jgi:Leucine-rich repeat (LRR) protein
MLDEKNKQPVSQQILKIKSWDNVTSASEVLPNIVTLIIYDSKEPEIDLSDVPMEQLSTIHIKGKTIERVNMTPFSRCSELTQLYISNSSVTEIDLSSLSQCRNLNHLFISSNQITELDLTPLSSLPNIEHLYLRDNRLEDIDLTPIRSKSLVHLNLADNMIKAKFLDLSGFERWPNLATLFLGGNEISLVDITALLMIPGFYHTDLCTGKGNYAYLIGEKVFKSKKLPVGIEELFKRDHVSMSWYERVDEIYLKFSDNHPPLSYIRDAKRIVF